MPYAYKPCLLEINNNVEFKREYVEFCSTTMPMTTKLGRMGTYHKRLLQARSRDKLKILYLPYKVPIVTKFAGIVT